MKPGDYRGREAAATLWEPITPNSWELSTYDTVSVGNGGGVGVVVKVETYSARSQGSPWAWGPEWEAWLGRWLLSFHMLSAWLAARRFSSYAPGALALPRVPAEQAGKEGARGQLRRHRSWLPSSSGWAPVGLEPVPIFLTRLLGHLGQL